MEKIQVLQIGSDNYKSTYSLPEYLEWTHVEELDPEEKVFFDLVLLYGPLEGELVKLLDKHAQCYRLFVVTKPQWTYSDEVQKICEKYYARNLSFEQVADFLKTEARNFYGQGYGEKFRMHNLAIAQMFRGEVSWQGNASVTLSGKFGDDFAQIVFWRNNLPFFQGQALDLWLEYEKSEQVSVQLEIIRFEGGQIAQVGKRWVFDEVDMQDIVTVENESKDGYLFAAVRAKGEGTLKITALHDRYSRRGYGYFIPGGERHVTSKRQELFSYFEPGKGKGPLCVYFAGYKTQQTFEGLFMMRKFGCPFVLLSESRMEGGCFYMGDEEYENMVRSVIQGYLDQLGYTAKQMIFSGLSMGTYGALYYGCDFAPHAIIAGKPLTSIGNVAANELSVRPGGFPTSVDVLLYLEGGLSEEEVEKLNQRFWEKYKNADFDQTKFIVSYMIEDDYDSESYQNMLRHLKSTNASLYGKGLHGRHNDDTRGIVNWFQSQYKKVIEEDF